MMTSLREAIRRVFTQTQPLPAGTHHFQAPPDSGTPYRLHLRLESNGRGLLIVNASTVLHLNQTAAEYAYHLVQCTPAEQAARQIASRYRIGRAKALQDFHDFADRIHTLVETPDLDPEIYLDFERAAPNSASFSAPLRLDCAITYQLPPRAQASYAPTRRVDRELSTEEWKTILQKASQVGVPHIIFTGGEPTLRQDLPELITFTESCGLVTGLLSDGVRLSDIAYLNTLLQTGLDHLLITLHPQDEQAWQGLENALAADLFVAVHLTLTLDNAIESTDLLKRLAEKGVKAISISAADPSLQNRLAELRDEIASLNISLVWNIPVPYSAFNPVALETLDEKATKGAGAAWLYVEPDGDVLPAQGVNQVLGNLLKDDWEKIWHPS
ncbi:MAG: radical SAM protein [Anaerolineales bacterium]|nr:radical SAM protein [Anaerolineales bacterium]